MGPLLTASVLEALLTARRAGVATVACSLDLQRSRSVVSVHEAFWEWQARRFAYPARLKPRTIYHFENDIFQPVARYSSSLIKLIPTDWGPPTFEVDGIKMLPTARQSPLADARHKVSLVRPRGKVVLDTCGGLGYFAACCDEAGAARVLSFEKNEDVLWLRSLNPWSPAAGGMLTLTHADITEAVLAVNSASVDAVLHDPPRFAMAGELYSQAFYLQLARVLRPHGVLFHYTGTPNKISRGRDLAAEVTKRLRVAGFSVKTSGDGVLAVKDGAPRPSRTGRAALQTSRVSAGRP